MVAWLRGRPSQAEHLNQRRRTRSDDTLESLVSDSCASVQGRAAVGRRVRRVAPQSRVRGLRGGPDSTGNDRLRGRSPAVSQRLNVTCVTPLGVLTASTSKRSSNPSRPSQSRSPRPRTIGVMTTCI